MDSDEYTTDDGKRKKGPDDSVDFHSRSKITARTPVKKRDTEDKIDRILEALGSLTQEVKELRKEQKEYREEVKELRRENGSLREENTRLKSKIEGVEEKIEKMERDGRRNNMVIQGIKVNTDNQNLLKEMVEDFMENTLRVKISVRNARRINDHICLVELNNATDKEKVMKSKSKLKEMRDSKIFINDDMSKLEREIQAKVRNKAKEERSNGNRVKIGFQKVIVNDQVWKWNKEKEEWIKEKVGDKTPKN